MSELPPDCVARIRAGELAAFEGLYRVMHAPLVAFATRYTGESARAEELVQDVFFAVWQERASWPVQGSASAYLYAAVRNRALNLRRRDAVESDWIDDEAQPAVRVLHATPPTAAEVFERDETVERVRAAMTRLPERCGLVMQMRWHGNLSHAEIAEVLGISVKGVEHQLSRGLRALRGMLGGPER